jgi:exoribonuclease R
MRVMRAHGFDPDFSAAVQQQLEAIGRQPAAAPGDDVRDVRDLRTTLWSSIDNDTSRDLQQQIVLQDECSQRLLTALIEDFMIAANEVVARRLDELRVTLTRTDVDRGYIDFARA